MADALMCIVIYVLPVAAGFLVDAVLGDPQGWPHPVRWMGKFILLLEKLLYRESDKPGLQLFKGGVLVAAVVSAAYTLPAIALGLALKINIFFYIFIASLFCYWALAARSLCSESMKVCKSLKAGDVEKARYELSWIVGRDTQELSCEQVARAAVETVAENCSDGVIAPLFFLLLGAAPLGTAYKAVNTLDSMLGYKSEKYLYFGRAAARLDDFVNLIPARLSAVFLLLSGLVLCGLRSAKSGLKIFLRDRYNHTSPNSAQTEAVCAGLLGIRLGGSAYYNGRLVKKPTIGDRLREVEPEDIVRTNRIMYLAAVFSLIMLSFLRCIV